MLREVAAFKMMWFYSILYRSMNMSFPLKTVNANLIFFSGQHPTSSIDIETIVSHKNPRILSQILSRITNISMTLD